MKFPFASAAARGRMHARVLGGVLLCLAGTVWAHGNHTHGHGTARIVADGPLLTATLDVPLESYLGFDYPPRNEAQQQAWADLRARLREPLRFVEPAADAQCVASDARVEPDPEQAHADIDNLVLTIRFDCARPEALKSVGFTAFREHSGLKQLRVQLQNGKARKTLTVRPRFPAVMF